MRHQTLNFKPLKTINNMNPKTIYIVGGLALAYFVYEYVIYKKASKQLATAVAASQTAGVSTITLASIPAQSIK